MANRFLARLLLSVFLATSLLEARPLLVISIDGLDHRYLRDRDQLGLKIPNLRRLLAEGSWASKGVIGVVPTVTFPSHTTMVTGVPPAVHGVINNNQPNGERYWFSTFIKVPALWDAARKAGLRTGTVHWPVTVGAAIDWDFPEYFQRRRGAGMDWTSTAEKATPGLIAKMMARFPSIAQEWIDDRVRTLATIYLLEREKPDLLLVHLIDHDSEAHETGPFSVHAKAVLEYQDELLGRILAAAPREMAMALVSDHGFERVDRVVNVWAALKQADVTGSLQSFGTYLTTSDPKVAEFLRKSGIVGREIPAGEWKRFQPDKAAPLAAFESRPQEKFTPTSNAAGGARPRESGDHGFWPLRADYRSTYLLWGQGIRKSDLGEIDMLSIASRLAAAAGIPFGRETR